MMHPTVQIYVRGPNGAPIAVTGDALGAIGATGGTEANPSYVINRKLTAEDDTVATVAASTGLSASATFTPAAASHVANDCNGVAAEIDFGATAGSSAMITSATLEIDGATAEVTGWKLQLYNVTPPSAIADDGAWDLPSGDRASYLGVVSLGTAVDQGATQWVESNGINKQIKLAGDSVFAYLVNDTTLTPAAVAHKVTLHAVAL